jgi:hypothetical protein
MLRGNVVEHPIAHQANAKLAKMLLLLCSRVQGTWKWHFPTSWCLDTTLGQKRIWKSHFRLVLEAYHRACPCLHKLQHQQAHDHVIHVLRLCMRFWPTACNVTP